MQSWIFSIVTQSSVSHDPSEIILICWLAAQETLLLSKLETVVLRILWSIVFWWKIFILKKLICKITNVFTALFNVPCWIRVILNCNNNNNNNNNNSQYKFFNCILDWINDTAFANILKRFFSKISDPKLLNSSVCVCVYRPMYVYMDMCTVCMYVCR